MEKLYKMKINETVNVDLHTTVQRVPGGWRYITALREGITSDFIPYNKEFEPKKEKAIQTAIEFDSQEITKLINYWNGKGIVKCIKATSEIEKSYKNAIKSFGKENIKIAIDNYSTVLNDKEYFFNTIWSLKDFLKQSNAMPTFMKDGSKYLNYKKQASSSNVSSGFGNIERV